MTVVYTKALVHQHAMVVVARRRTIVKTASSMHIMMLMGTVSAEMNGRGISVTRNAVIAMKLVNYESPKTSTNAYRAKMDLPWLTDIAFLAQNAVKPVKHLTAPHPVNVPVAIPGSALIRAEGVRHVIQRARLVAEAGFL